MPNNEDIRTVQEVSLHKPQPEVVLFLGQQRVPLRRKKTHSWCPTVLGLHIQARLFQVHSGRPGCNRRPGAWWFARVSLRGGLYSMLFGLQQTRDVFTVVHTTANAYKCQYTQRQNVVVLLHHPVSSTPRHVFPLILRYTCRLQLSRNLSVLSKYPCIVS